MTMDEAVATQPPRLRLVNMRTGKGIVAQFNPQQLKEQASAQWEDKQVIGQSHTRSHYVGTTNHEVPLDLYFNKMVIAQIREENLDLVGIDEIATYEFCKNFCFSLLYASATSGIINGGPARCLVIWPHVLSMQCTTRSVSVTHTRFSGSAASCEMTIGMVFREVRDSRLTSEDVLQMGSRRF